MKKLVSLGAALTFTGGLVAVETGVGALKDISGIIATTKAGRAKAGA